MRGSSANVPSLPPIYLMQLNANQLGRSRLSGAENIKLPVAALQYQIVGSLTPRWPSDTTAIGMKGKSQPN